MEESRECCSSPANSWLACRLWDFLPLRWVGGRGKGFSPWPCCQDVSYLGKTKRARWGACEPCQASSGR